MATTNERSILGTADVKFNGEVYPNIEIALITATNEYQGVKKVSEYYTTAPIPDAGLKPTDLRLYGRKGMNADFDTVIKPLFEGQIVELKGLVKKSGDTYNGKFIFNADEVPSYLKKPLFKGVLDFAPRD